MQTRKIIINARKEEKSPRCMALGITTRTSYDPTPGQPPPPSRRSTRGEGFNDNGFNLTSHTYEEFDFPRVFTQTQPRKIPDNALEAERKGRGKSPRDPLNLGPLRKEQRRVAALMRQRDIDLPVHWNYRNRISKRTAPVYLCKQFDPEGKFRNPALDFLQEGLDYVKARRELDAIEKIEAEKLKEEENSRLLRYSLDSDVRHIRAPKDYQSEVQLVTRSLGGGQSNWLPNIRDNDKVTSGKQDSSQNKSKSKSSIPKGYKKNPKRRKTRRSDTELSPPPLVDSHAYDSYRSTKFDQGDVPSESDELPIEPIDPSAYIDEETNSETSYKTLSTFPPLLDTKPTGGGIKTGGGQQIRYHYGIPVKGVTNEEITGMRDEDSFVLGKKQQRIRDSRETQRSNSSLISPTNVKIAPKIDIKHCDCEKPRPKTRSGSTKCGECLGSGQHEMWCSSKDVHRQKTVCGDCGLALASTSMTSARSSGSSSRPLTVISTVESHEHGSEGQLRKSSSRKKLKSRSRKLTKSERKPETPIKIEMAIPALPEVTIKESTPRLKYEPKKKPRTNLAIMSFGDIDDEPEPVVVPQITSRVQEKTEEQIELENKMFQIQLLNEQDEKAKRLCLMKDLNPHSSYGEAYNRALADARAKRLPLEPWMLGQRTTNAYVYSYFSHLPNKCLCGKCSTCDKPATIVPKRAKKSKKESEMKSIFGNLNVNDYYPGGNKNPLKLNNFMNKNDRMKFK
ncbi:unnamed protein product [Owenia fusiformis]|uniref:Uncharacterized protein n=1 Tax=Owenia fusiformis TaxID=6347 RepID=A0A8S4MZN9_OWEFU|nr:unnamed protein product [Owenia fusiformis]